MQHSGGMAASLPDDWLYHRACNEGHCQDLKSLRTSRASAHAQAQEDLEELVSLGTVLFDVPVVFLGPT